MRCKFIPFAIVFILSACGFAPVEEVRYITDSFEPTDQVDVLYTWPRDRKYIEISALEVSAGDDAVNALIDKAKEIGADAIVIGGSHPHGYVDVPINSKTPATGRVTLDSIHAIALKYKPGFGRK